MTYKGEVVSCARRPLPLLPSLRRLRATIGDLKTVSIMRRVAVGGSAARPFVHSQVEA